MDTYSLSQLARRTDQALLQDFSTLVTHDRSNCAMIVAHLAVIDFRRLYLQAAYKSMHAYCMKELRMSEDVAFKLIRTARTARRFPDILPALAEGRLHVSAVVLLSAYLNEANAGELLAAATHKSKRQVEQLLAERFPQPDVPTRIVPWTPKSASSPIVQMAAGPVEATALLLAHTTEGALQQAPYR